jgi:hypothetical protein
LGFLYLRLSSRTLPKYYFINFILFRKEAEWLDFRISSFFVFYDGF